MSPVLPARPDLEHLKKQAKALLHDYQQRDPAAIERFRSLGSPPEKPKLADAQHVIAREYGLSSWAQLKKHIKSLGAEPDPRKALIAAVESDNVQRARELLTRHAELRATINDPAPELSFGGRPIGEVVQHKNREMVDLFLEFGADINARSDWWAGSFGVLDGGDPEFAQFLISRGARVDAHSAARLGMLDTLRQLVGANPALVHARGGDGQTPLHFASSIEIADYLLEQGADIDALDVDHEGTPAQWMISDRTEIARHLVRRGAKTDFLMAVALGDVDVVRKYLDANPESVRTSATPGYFPMRNPHAGGHIYLWSLGRNKTAHHIAKDFGHDDVWRLLMQRSPNELKLLEACRLGDDALVKELLAKQPDLTRDMPNEMRGRLVEATQDGNLTAVRTMLAAGWPTDGRGQDDGTALHWAGFLGNAEIARELLRYNVAIEDRERMHDGTPLGWAIYGSVHSWTCKTGDHVGAVKALLDAGAKPPVDMAAASEAVRDFFSRYSENA